MLALSASRTINVEADNVRSSEMIVGTVLFHAIAPVVLKCNSELTVEGWDGGGITEEDMVSAEDEAL